MSTDNNQPKTAGKATKEILRMWNPEHNNVGAGGKPIGTTEGKARNHWFAKKS